MSGEQRFDAIVIGAGQAGPFLGATLVARGMKVALIEERDLGGTCVNRGCTPTKTLRKSARVAHMARRASEFGVQTGSVQVNFRAAMERMQRRVEEARSGLQAWLGQLEGLTIIKARGRLAGREGEQFVVLAGEHQLVAPKVVLNTGTRPFVPPVPGLDELPFLDNERLLALRELPSRLVIIGGGYISLEMAQIFRRLGSEVAILETGPRLTAREDEDIAAAVTGMLTAEGIEVNTGVRIERVGKADNDAGVRVQLAGGRSVDGSHLLVATGRIPNTDCLGLETVGLEVSARGYLVTNDRLETAVPGIWALGDINQRGAFTHTAYHDHEIVLAHRDGLTDLHQWQGADARVTTYAMFTDPPLGRVGLTRAEAQALVAHPDFGHADGTREPSQRRGRDDRPDPVDRRCRKRTFLRRHRLRFSG